MEVQTKANIFMSCFRASLLDHRDCGFFGKLDRKIYMGFFVLSPEKNIRNGPILWFG